MRVLKAKLLVLKEEERLRELENLRGPHKEIAWGSQIRSYVFQPYTLVKDHRTGVEDVYKRQAYYYFLASFKNLDFKYKA